MRTTVVTGAAGGMGLAIRTHLEAKGERVIGVDIADTDVIADLSTEDGRAAMIEEVGRLCGGKLDGVVAGAGVANRPDIPGDLVTSVNYFGGVMLDASPGLAGHQHYFTFLAAFAAVGLMTSLALVVGVYLGHSNARSNALANFVQDCSTSRFAVVFDENTDAHRHFHCFEVATEEPAAAEANG